MRIWTRCLPQNADLARYKPVFDRIRAMKPYQLSDELEKFLHDLGVVATRGSGCLTKPSQGWSLNVDGEQLNIEGTLNLLTDQTAPNARPPAASWPSVSEQHQNLCARAQHPGQGKRDR